ncbi:septum formation protein Maf [Afipia carboxidovorans OM5]|uniref:Nucleoside triphosphate pyrophosphatase n=1 Tax=Afipia carboxidovorans (strain ATCC 49405 / DSM 1227 / KCTC 32145 / OM5) TaxID=504832 RepID=B6JAK7_AFIC5|nr:Maf family nucleotide pyrophosphatase [Afipia carboxidovorans]ACI91532.1 septum formation protein Maf [Afipia carboxidovorans OM5]AEI01303.1 Maf-like protein [Afipia carboxidovorans OM4]AEI04877.1 Maf-like protein [Afipia carboxidovorans OM5]
MATRAAARLILASQSASRQMLLRRAGVTFEALPADLDERAIEQSSSLVEASQIAALLAREKAKHVGRAHPEAYVIGADQTLGLGSKIFAKAESRAEARSQLKSMCGQTHELHSAVAVVRGESILFETLSSARMTVRPLTEAQIDAYLDLVGDAVMASVGGYQLEGAGVHLFEKIEGDYFTILGLPLLPLLGFLRGHGLAPLA